ncbi:hypothetical protein HYFRA_00012873 [Hymenoscyphus fraxineus]|uniref:Uncharacterized protein n=1 Tax=Hymenoscyphus fraxineus TaxID=746836 RepID=A0A9N9PYW1_9HELO|nr:hypothetical protein HYFRA_00012873 [Hymenoscyphus fraxineus]
MDALDQDKRGLHSWQIRSSEHSENTLVRSLLMTVDQQSQINFRGINHRDEETHAMAMSVPSTSPNDGALASVDRSVSILPAHKVLKDYTLENETSSGINQRKEDS